MTQNAGMSQESGIAKLDAAIQDAITLISERMKTRLMPVDRKVFAVIHSRLLELNGALSRDRSLVEMHAEKILGTVKLVDDGLKDDAAWDVADYLKELLPVVASDDWVYRALLEEKGRRADSPYGWKTLCEDAKLIKFIESYDGSLPAAEGKVARQNLTALYVIRNDNGRHDRARERLRARYLRQVALGLFSLLVISVAWMLSFNTLGPLSPIIIVFFAGGLGAVLSGIIRIRDVERIVQIDKVWRTMLSQVALGGTLAVIVLVTLQTGLVRLATLDFSGTLNPVFYYLVGLISGYSEPFALGLLKKVVELGK
jgi:hypothetical protein